MIGITGRREGQIDFDLQYVNLKMNLGFCKFDFYDCRFYALNRKL